MTAAAAPALGPVPTRRYRILGVIGRGGFGTVYRADLLGDGDFVRPVALKVLNPNVEHVATVAARLRDEARVLGRIRHRSIVQVDGLVRIDDRWTVVMEYVDGVDLCSVVARGPAPARAALEIVGEVAAALAVAYSWPSEDGSPLGLLHRDLKPANVLVTPAGEVKVVDFGLARGRFAAREAETQGMRFGSPGYVAPERLEGVEQPAGDVYSLGVLAYELLAGRPMDRPSVRRDRAEPHVRAALDALAAPPGVRALLREMLAWDPGDRPAEREVERRCRTLAGEVGGAYLRDWAEEVVPGLLAKRRLASATADFSSDLVTEGGPTSTRQRAIVEEPDVAEDVGLVAVTMLVVGGLVLAATCGGLGLSVWMGW